MLQKLRSAFSKLADWFSSPSGQRTLNRIAELAQAALPIVETVAALTPTRADDEIIKVYKYYGLPVVESWLADPPADRGLALLDLATNVVQKRFPSVPTRLVQAGVQMAYVQFRESKEQTNG